MTRWLLDTNLLLRGVDRADPRYPLAREAIRRLVSRGDLLHLTLQNLTEFWNVCTRPTSARGGLGRSVAEADRRVRQVERYFTFLDDTSAVRVHWRHLVVNHQVQGVQVHDARLVASMLAHGITHLLTFNAPDFGRYSGIVVVPPEDVLAGRA